MEENTESRMTRRGFVGAMGAMGSVLMAVNAVQFASGEESVDTSGCETNEARTPSPVDCRNRTEAVVASNQGSMPKPWAPRSDYPGETAKNPNVVPLISAPAPSVLTPEEVDELINNEITVTEDYVKADGTVVPAAYINMRNKVNRNGIGIGSKLTTDDHWDVWEYLATEHEAECYSEMPQYVDFTAADYALKSGRDEQSCVEVCDALARKGLLHCVHRGGNSFYHTQTSEYGLYEARATRLTKEYLDKKDAGDGEGSSFVDSGTSMYRTFPVDLSVVKGEHTPFDDWHAILDRNDTFSVSPCVCRTRNIIAEKIDHLDCDHPVETCLCTGEHAKYMIEYGDAREITREEAESILQNAVDQGMLLESVYTRNAENICCCHADCCLNVGAVRKLNGGPSIETYSNFYLAHDTDICIKCGACAARCPMFSITMDEQTGYPIVDSACLRCGQCATVCPVDARWLVLKPQEDRPYIPHDLIEDYECKARVRAAKGLLYDYRGQSVEKSTADASSSSHEGR